MNASTNKMSKREMIQSLQEVSHATGMAIGVLANRIGDPAMQDLHDNLAISDTKVGNIIKALETRKKKPKKQWYIVIGRLDHDENSGMSYYVESQAEAQERFEKWAFGEEDLTPDNPGDRQCYVDHIICTGQQKPAFVGGDT